MMRAGRLRHRVVVETPTEDINGGATTWAPLATVYAGVEPITGREYFGAQQVQAEITHRVVMRYTAGVTAKHRVRFGARVFDIRAAINRDERNRELELLCVERT
jgi:SPP1 family predicted phage head-tail adaptor